MAAQQDPAKEKIGVVTGLLAEARLLAGPDILTFASGSIPGRTNDGARELVARGASCLVSFGLAGGLDPSLKAGALVFPEQVVTPDGEHFACHSGKASRVGGLLSLACTGSLCGVDAPLKTVSEKRHLREKTGACAADMESHIVARVAKAAGIPFLALRVIADPAHHRVPESALRGLDEEGNTRPLAVLAGLLGRPQDIRALIVLACDMRKAMRALSRVGNILARGGF